MGLFGWWFFGGFIEVWSFFAQFVRFFYVEAGIFLVVCLGYGEMERIDWVEGNLFLVGGLDQGTEGDISLKFSFYSFNLFYINPSIIWETKGGLGGSCFPCVQIKKALLACIRQISVKICFISFVLPQNFIFFFISIGFDNWRLVFIAIVCVSF